MSNARYGEETWNKIRDEVLGGITDWSYLSEKYGPSRTAIRNKAKSKGWAKGLYADTVQQNARQKIAEKAKDRIPPVTEADPDAPEPDLSEATVSVERALTSHLAQAAQMRVKFNELMGLTNAWLGDDEKQREYAAKRLFASKGDGMANTMRALTSLAVEGQKLERQALGLDVKTDGGRKDAPADSVPLEDRVKQWSAEEETGNVVPIPKERAQG